ncbi:hypothetical protein GUJ93_ZPchr0008g12016 [Zizania palustris]|uniref:Uncharacterized protein n=1 Tax=Zizania palustris TaxID=103762 RepID=A0A8J5V475_ZIZPA|nr:hypothetical protein GUJ93_ZPchr0008g12016 [Zizania palustris]
MLATASRHHGHSPPPSLHPPATGTPSNPAPTLAHRPANCSSCKSSLQEIDQAFARGAPKVLTSSSVSGQPADSSVITDTSPADLLADEEAVNKTDQRLLRCES